MNINHTSQDAVQTAVNKLIEDSIKEDEIKHLNHLKESVQAISTIFEVLTPTNETELLAFNTLVDVQADQLKKIANTLYQKNIQHMTIHSSELTEN